MKQIVYTSATELVRKIKSREISVKEVVTAFLEQIKANNSTINAIIDLRNEQDILAEAAQKDEAIRQNTAIGLLHGLPMTIKDSFFVKGLINSNGDPLQRNYVATEDAELVKRLKAAGVIILGKTNTPLYCIDWQSTSFWNGQTNNPYDLGRVVGGSSGGSSASVAAGFSPLELGADAGGSVRVPAHFCGICGLRPTENYLSNRGHLKAPNKPQGRRHVVTPGPFAKNVEDLMLLMEVLGNNAQNPLPELPPIDFSHSSWSQTPLRIAYADTINNINIDQEYLALFHRFIDQLKGTSHQLTKAAPTWDEKKAFLIYSKILGFENGVSHPNIPFMSAFLYAFIRFKYRDHLWAKGTALGHRLSNKQYAKDIDYKDEFSGIFDEFLTSYDIWITPVCAFEAFKHQNAGKPFIVNGQKVRYMNAIGSFTFTTAFSGHPIVVIPIGRKQNGLPVGIQIHSRKWTDKRLLEIAQYLEGFTSGFEIPDKLVTANLTH